MAFKLLPEEKEPSTIARSAKETALRAPLVGAAGALAAVPGSVGNIFAGINSLVAAPLTEAITGKTPVPYEETGVGKVFPTSRTHLKNLQEGIPALKPRNKAEKFIQDFSTDAVELFTPGKIFKMGNYAMGPVRSMGVSLASNAGGEFVNAFTGDEGKSNAVKNGVMLGLSLFNPTTAKGIANGLYDKARTALPKNAVVDTTRLEKGLDSIENTILGGRPLRSASSSERWVIDQVNKVRRLVDLGEVSVDQLTKQKKSLNDELQKFVYDLPDKAARNQTKGLAKRINGEIRQTMQEYGKKNPEWWKYQSEGDEAFGAIAQSNFISRGLERFMKGRPEALAHIFGVGLPAGFTLVSGPGAVLGTAAYQAAKLITRVSKSPELRKHYAKVVGAAAAENPKLINGELDRLQKELDLEQEKKNSKYKLLPQE